MNGEIKDLLKKVAEEIKANNENFDWIIAVTRGGMVPACLLSEYLDIRSVDTICTQLYNNDRIMDKLELFGKTDYSHLTGQKILVVDDLVDSGRTLDFVVDYLKGFDPIVVKTAVIYEKTEGFKPDYFGETADPNKWIVFDWEE